MDKLGFHLSFLKGCISGCMSPNEMGVKSTGFRNNHSLMVLGLLVNLLSGFFYDLFYECIIFVDTPCIFVYGELARLVGLVGGIKEGRLSGTQTCLI